MAENLPTTKKAPPIIAFTSGKGGSGKTTLAVNFANIVTQSGHKVLLVDLDLSNRGSTGLFSNWLPQAHEKLTTLRLIRGDFSFHNACREVLEVKPGRLYFLPAASPDEEAWIEPNKPDVAQYVKMVRTRILELAEKCEIACVILDCFCGVDLLTTTAASMADDTILVNEPDIITFTGSINLLAHLYQQFGLLARQPRIHVMVNRVRSNQTVPQLTQLYRGNVAEIIKEPILCYFPYDPRVFENFGRYPFISDLLPRSLFVKKLKLLSYLLFTDGAKELVHPSAAHWSRGKIRSIYLRTLDPSAVDAQYLVLKLTQFPVLLGLWAVIWLLLFRSFPISPTAVWQMKLILLPAAGILFATTVLYGFWLAARLNLSLATFQFRLARMQERGWEKLQALGRSVTSFTAGVLLLIGLTWLAYLLAEGAMLFGESMDFADQFHGKKQEFRKSQVASLLSDGFVRVADLRGETIMATNLSHFYGHFDSSDSDWRIGFFELGRPKKILVDNATFLRCEVDQQIFQRGSKWRHCLFEECNFSAGYFGADQKIQIVGSLFDGTTFRNSATDAPIIFRESEFIEANIESAASAKIGFVRCAFDSHHPTHLKSQSSEESRLYLVPESPSGLISEGNFRQTTDETSLAQTRSGLESHEPDPNKVEPLPDRIERIEKLLAETRNGGPLPVRVPLSDLCELYILQNQPDSFARADAYLNELAQIAHAAHDSGSTGTVLMLRLLKCIVSTSSFEPSSACKNEKNNWEEWLTNNPAALRTRWIWNAWTKYSPTASYSDAQLAAIREVQMQATGTFAEVSRSKLLSRQPPLQKQQTGEREIEEQRP